MEAAWVVVGFWGDRSSYEEWLVAAYPTPDQAEDHARRARGHVAGLPPLPPLPASGLMPYPAWAEAHRLRREWVLANPNPYDRVCSGDADEPTREGSPPDYRVKRVPFARHVDEYLERG